MSKVESSTFLCRHSTDCSGEVENESPNIRPNRHSFSCSETMSRNDDKIKVGGVQRVGSGTKRIDACFAWPAGFIGAVQRGTVPEDKILITLL